jgi:Winged helix DNA-binding domain
MTSQELIDARRKRFHIAGNPIRTIEDARHFLNEVGFCLMYPLRHPIPAPIPTFIGAFIGNDTALPYSHIAFADPRAKDATELMVRLLREKSAFESNLFEDSGLLISAELFPYFYALIGDKTPKTPPKLTGAHKVSRLAVDVYAEIEKHGSLTKEQLKEYLGGSISDAGMDRALNELWAILKTTRVDYSPERGASWGILAKWAPEAVQRGARMSAPEAISAIISRYLPAIIAADEKEIEEFVGQFASRGRAAEIVKALTAARELEPFPLDDGRALLQVSAVAPAPLWKQQPAPARKPKSFERGQRRG